MTSPTLRSWQKLALDGYTATWPRDYLVTATPGSGKTTLGLVTARALFDSGRARRLIVVTPTDHLRAQWVAAASKAGFDLRTTPNRDRLPKDADGVVVTYAQVAAAPAVFTARCATTPTVVVFDELHHAGDQNSWGIAVLEAFDGARHRLGITGTPFRSDSARIPHVRYEPVEDAPGVVQSVADFTYGYTQALTDAVVRPVVFAAYSGSAQWRSSAGEVLTAMLGDPTLTRSTEDAAWRTALSPDGEWIPHVFSAMENRVAELRAGAIPDAGALVLASNQETARAYADVWEVVNGYRPMLVLSDDPASSAAIAAFRDDPDARACISVRMISEGVDCPRAAVLGFCTTASTPLFFAQAVGRVVRSRRRGEVATVFLPAVSRIVGLAATMERERNHVLDPPDTGVDLDVIVPDPEPPVMPDGDEPTWSPLESTAVFHEVIPGSRAQPDDGALPGLLTPGQEAALLARHDETARVAARAASRARAAATSQATEDRAAAVRRSQFDGTLADVVGGATITAGPTPAGTPIGQANDHVADMRRTIAARVMSRSRSTGQSPATVWGELYRSVPGPKNAAAPIAVLTRRVAASRTW